MTKTTFKAVDLIACDYAKEDHQNKRANGIVAKDKKGNVYLLVSTKKELKDGVFKEAQIDTRMTVSGEIDSVRIHESWSAKTPVIVISVAELKCTRNARKVNKE